jgi:hypothetical protein
VLAEQGEKVCPRVASVSDGVDDGRGIEHKIESEKVLQKFYRVRYIMRTFPRKVIQVAIEKFIYKKAQVRESSRRKYGTCG